MQIEFFGATDVGLVRTNNEDNFLIQETINGQLFIVCDGMGGHEAGEVASEIATQQIFAYLNSRKFDNLYVALNDALKKANQAILDASQSHDVVKNMGTTAVVLLIKEHEVYIAHVGDSRTYLLQNKKLYRATKDHSLVQQLVDGGIISADDVENHPRKNELTKALGTQKEIEPEVMPQSIKPIAGDVLLLCSDGLCGLITDKEIEQLISSKSESPEFIINGLISSAKNAGGHDNITSIVIRVTASPNKTSSFIANNNANTQKNKPKLEGNFRLKIYLLIAAIFIIIGVWFVLNPEKKKEEIKKVIPVSPEVKRPNLEMDTTNQKKILPKNDSTVLITDTVINTVPITKPKEKPPKK